MGKGVCHLHGEPGDNNQEGLAFGRGRLHQVRVGQPEVLPFQRTDAGYIGNSPGQRGDNIGLIMKRFLLLLFAVVVALSCEKDDGINKAPESVAGSQWLADTGSITPQSDYFIFNFRADGTVSLREAEYSSKNERGVGILYQASYPRR